MNLLGFAAKNALRNRFRTSLTVIGVAVAIVAFVLLRTVITSWNVAAMRGSGSLDGGSPTFQF